MTDERKAQLRAMDQRTEGLTIGLAIVAGMAGLSLPWALWWLC